ncbi:MAG: tyrosine-type recombinase/integrase [Candidatus Binataceae bacterium]
MSKNSTVQITKAVVEAARPPASGQRFIRDRLVRGFGLRVTADGVKSFVFEGRIRGRVRRITIARWPDLNVMLARARAQEIRTAIAQGRDPAEERIAERRQTTFGGLVDIWLDDYARPYRKSWPTDDRRLRTHCAYLHSRRLSDVSDSDLGRLHRKIAESSGPVEANRVVELLRAVFNHALRHKLMAGSNPAAAIKKFPEHARERFLSPDELRAINTSLMNETDWRWRSFFPLALFMGPRKAELAAAKWADVDLDQRTWLIPTTKTGKSHLLPLPMPAVEIIQALPSRGRSEWVFPARVKSASGHIENIGAAWDRIRRRAGVPDIRVHDLRRTAGSWMASAGFSLPIIGKMLGHSNPASTAIYARLDLAPVREALETNAAAMRLVQ